jgi:hypothetical protein
MTPILAAVASEDLRTLLVVAGVGQIVLALASLGVPRVLGWRAELMLITPLTRQVFWTYAAYVLGVHLAFGVLSSLAPDLLLDGSALARTVCAFICLWWAARLFVAVLGRERGDVPQKPVVRAAHVVLQVAFLALAAGYGVLAITGGAV